MTKPPGVKRNFLHQILKTVEEHGEHHLRSAKEDQVSAEQLIASSFTSLMPHARRTASRLLSQVV